MYQAWGPAHHQRQQHPHPQPCSNSSSPYSSSEYPAAVANHVVAYRRGAEKKTGSGIGLILFIGLVVGGASFVALKYAIPEAKARNTMSLADALTSSPTALNLPPPPPPPTTTTPHPNAAPLAVAPAPSGAPAASVSAAAKKKSPKPATQPKPKAAVSPAPSSPPAPELPNNPFL